MPGSASHRPRRRPPGHGPRGHTHTPRLTAGPHELIAEGATQPVLCLLQSGERRGGPMDPLQAISLFVARGKYFFGALSNVGCSVEEFCACDSADILFNVEEVMGKALVPQGNGVSISEPVKVRTYFEDKGGMFRTSLSHKGVLAVCSLCKGFVVQLTRLKDNKQVEFKIENESHIGFYDDKILLLTLGGPLRESRVKCVFNNPNVCTFQNIKDSKRIRRCPDVSSLNKTMMLYYISIENHIVSYDLITKKQGEIITNWVPKTVISSTGINVKARAVFQGKNSRLYSLNDHNETEIIGAEFYGGLIEDVIPYGRIPEDLTRSGFRFGKSIKIQNLVIDVRTPIEFECNYSIIRIYKDIFLLYDSTQFRWVLVRIVVD